MNAGMMQRSRRWLLMVTIAMILALSANYAPVALSVLTGAPLVTAVYACQQPGGGCG